MDRRTPRCAERVDVRGRKHGPGDLSYAFDPATLAGTATYTSKPGACNDPNVLQHQNPISLLPA